MTREGDRDLVTPQFKTEVFAVTALGLAAPVERIYLMVFAENSSRMIPLPRHGEVVIGRAPEAEVRLEETAVSRQHAVISLDDGRATIRDLGSQNGTHVDGVRVNGERPLRSGAVITVCNTQLVFHGRIAGQRGRAIDLERFRARLDAEIERAAALDRSLAVVAVRAEQPDEWLLDALAEELRGVDWAAAVGPTSWSRSCRSSTPTRRRRWRAAGERGGRRRRGARAGYACLPARRRRRRGAAGRRALGAGGGRARARRRRRRRLPHHRDRRGPPHAGRRRGDVAPHRAPRAAGRCRPAGPGARRDRHRQGAGGRRGPPPVAAQGRAAGLLQLRRHPGDPGRERAVRPREGRLLRRASAPRPACSRAPAAGPCSSTRSASCRSTIQAKLLRVLETRRLTRVGSVAERPIDVRVVAATNRDLLAEVEAGRFRRDLYFRLSAAAVWLPPLRDRPREIAALAQSFLDAARRGPAGARRLAVRRGAAAAAAYPWPGNVRELQELHGVPRRRGARRDSSTPARSSPTCSAARAHRPAGAPASCRRRRRTAALLPPDQGGAARARGAPDDRGAAARPRGNQTLAAALIEMPLRTFVAKVKQYGIDVKTLK